jgi:aminoglycoside/choline kinase family phosphotransferase
LAEKELATELAHLGCCTGQAILATGRVMRQYNKKTGNQKSVSGQNKAGLSGITRRCFGTFAQFHKPFNYLWRLAIGPNMTESDTRYEELVQWVGEIPGLARAAVAPASADASFRRYFRVVGKDGSYIVMDAPPAQEDCAPFMQIAAWLKEMGLNAPEVLDKNLQKGFLLLSDLGSTQFLAVLRDYPERADDLYNDALDALVRLQHGGTRFQDKLPKYDRSLLEFELSLFHDWLCQRHLGITLNASERVLWQATVDLSVRNALAQPQVFVHRDYHSRNLMFTEHDNPGILDFQDAVQGPYTYDLVSLLKDCYIAWPQQRIKRWAMQFHRRISDDAEEPTRFLRHFELMGLQRQLKAAGIFARLNHRDGKPAYLNDIPRTLTYILDIAPRYPELEFLSALIGERILPALKVQTT